MFLLLCLWLPAGKEALAIKRVAVKDAQHIVQIGKRACLVRPAGKRNILGRLKKNSRKLVLIPAPKKFRAKALRAVRTSRPAKGLAALYVECLKKNWKAHLKVEPQGDFISHGALEGLIAPSEKTYTLTNTGIEPLSWSAKETQPWITVLPASGTLGAGKSAKLIVSFKKDQVSLLLEGEHKGKLTFSNLTNSSGNTSRSIMLTLAAGPLYAGSISQYGITWTFDKLYRAGQFVNGDWWVVGPATITRISPDFDGQHNGWEVNPCSREYYQGFDIRIYSTGPSFRAERVPNLPYHAQPGASLVKAVSLEPFSKTDCRPCLQTAAVLTVVSEVPPGNGAEVFRPPYFGSEKPYYDVNQLQPEILPALARPVQESLVPDLDSLEGSLRQVQLDHILPAWLTDFLHPADSMPYYPSSISRRNAEVVLRLMLNDPLPDKMPLLLAFIQYGIDLYYIGRIEHPNPKYGLGWDFGGGEGESRKLPIAFAALLLDNSAMRSFIESSALCSFGENGGVVDSPKADNDSGKVLFGQKGKLLDGAPRCWDYGDPEYNYWYDLTGKGQRGSKVRVDPYGYIDGGFSPGQSYQFCCLSQPWKGNVLAAELLPGLKVIWEGQHGGNLLTYVDRWVNFGAWAQPDPCAPATGVCSGGTNPGAACTSASGPEVCGSGGECDLMARFPSDYGVLYGPDPFNPGHCIVDADPSDGIGRFPHLHGSNRDAGYYRSAFVDEMWRMYR